jgi:P-type Ca2+ transporter type 2C
VFNMASAQSKLFVNEITKNKFVWFALLICTAQMILVFAVPQMRMVLGLNLLSSDMWMVAIIASLIPLVLVQLYKIVFGKRQN